MSSARTASVSDLAIDPSGSAHEVVHTILHSAHADYNVAASAVELDRLKPLRLLGRSSQGLRVLQVILA